MALGRTEVLQVLRGKEIRIPSIWPFIQHWPQGRSPHYESLVPMVDLRLETLVPDRRKLPKLKQCDFGLFACLVWPWLELDKLYIMACFSIWLFLWDDEIDESAGEYESDLDGAQQYRLKTLAFVEQSIGLRDHGLEVDKLHPYIGSFAVIGDEVRDQYDERQKQVFMNEVTAFVHATAAEQRIKQTDQLWDANTYWRYRTSTSAVGIFSALVELTLGEKVPARFSQSKAVKQVWHETNMIISISNDLFSLKKEIPQGGLDSAIPIACALGVDIQTAIDEAIEDLRVRCSRLQTCIDDFLDEGETVDVRDYGPSDDAVHIKSLTPVIINASELLTLEKFVECHQLICTGITKWSISTSRYGLQACEQDADGTIVVSLAVEATSRVLDKLLFGLGLLPETWVSKMVANFTRADKART